MIEFAMSFAESIGNSEETRAKCELVCGYLKDGMPNKGSPGVADLGGLAKLPRVTFARILEHAGVDAAWLGTWEDLLDITFEPPTEFVAEGKAATRPGIGTNNKVVLGTTESTCVAYVGPAAARTQRSVSYASDGEFFIAYGLPTAHSKTHVDCPREVRNLRKVIENGGFLWVHESSRTSAPVGCRSSRRG